MSCLARTAALDVAVNKREDQDLTLWLTVYNLWRVTLCCGAAGFLLATSTEPVIDCGD